MDVDWNQWKRAEAFIEKYFNDKYITNYQKAEELSHNRTDGKNILAVLAEVVSLYEESKSLSAARLPSWSSLALLTRLINEVLFNGVLVDKGSQNIGMSSRMSFSTQVKEFLAELYELSDYNTRKPVDAFEVGRRLNLQEEKIDGIVNYVIQKRWVSEPDPMFNRVNTGDPPPSQKFRLIYITAEGIDELNEEESEPSVLPQRRGGDIYTTNIYNPQQSPTQIGKGSTQNVVFNEGQIAELQEILSKIEQITRYKAGEIPPENRAEVESDVRDIKQELAKPNRDNSRILSKFRSLGDKIKDLAPYAGLATQLLILLSSFSN